MNDDELDAMLSARFRAYAEQTHLPNGVKERLIRSVRHARTWRRVKMLVLAGMLVVAGVALLGLGAGEEKPGDTQLALVPATPRTNDTIKATYWILLSYLQECFKRNKGAKRKEEEED